MDKLRSFSLPLIMNEYTWKKHVYDKQLSQRPEGPRRVMIIYCGGTVGMMYTEKQGTRSESVCRYIPVLYTTHTTHGV